MREEIMRTLEKKRQMREEIARRLGEIKEKKPKKTTKRRYSGPIFEIGEGQPCWRSTGRVCGPDEYCSLESGECTTDAEEDFHILRVGKNKIIGEKEQLEYLKERLFDYRGEEATISPMKKKKKKKTVKISREGEIEIPEEVLEVPPPEVRKERVSKTQEKKISDKAAKEYDAMQDQIKKCLGII